MKAKWYFSLVCVFFTLIFLIISNQNAFSQSTISGTVTNAGPGGGALANVPVNVNGTSGNHYGDCTDNNGYYSISVENPDTYRVSAGGNNWCPGGGLIYAQVYYKSANNTTPDWNSAKQFDLVPGATLENIDFPGMVLGATVKGKVTIDGVTPLLNVPVSVHGPGWGMGGCTNSAGEYTISGIYPGPGITYRISAGGTNWCIQNGPVYAQVYYAENPPPTPDYNFAKLFTLNAGETQSGINFSGLVLGATVSGTVIVSGNSDPKNVPVSVNASGMGMGGCTDEFGKYIISGIYPGGPYRISAGGGQNWCGGPNYAQIYYNSQGNTPSYNSAQLFTLNSGDEKSGIDFSGLVLGANVKGKVTDVDNTPLAKIPINVSGGPGWGMGGCTDDNGNYAISGLYPSTGNPSITYKISAGGQNWCPGGPYYKQIFYDNKPNYDTATPVTLDSGDNVIDFSGLVPVTSISGDLKGDLSSGVQNLVVVLHDSQDRLVDVRINLQNTHYVFENLNTGTSYIIKVYDPFLNYQNTQGGPITVSSGMLNTLDINLTKLTPSGTNLPTFKSTPQVFVYRNPGDNQEYVNLSAEIDDPSGCQPPSIKSVTVVGPGPNGPLHQLYHQKYQALIDRGIPYGESWNNSRDNGLSYFLPSPVGDYTFTILDMEGNRVSEKVNLGSYTQNKLAIPTLFTPANRTEELDPDNLTLIWNPVTDAYGNQAARYQVRILEMGERIYRANVTETSFTIPAGILAPGRWYSWQVIAMDNATSDLVDYRSNSPTRSFRTAGGPTPTSQALTVNIVPWVSGSPLIPHDAYAGHETTLKAVVKGGTPPYTYTWDFGDGTPSSTSATSGLNLEAKHQYTASSITLFNATVTVTDRNMNTVSATYPVKFSDNPSRGVKVNVAIDDALWWLHKNLIVFTSGGEDYAYLPGGNSAGTIAMALQAWVLNGHKPDGDPNNPYTESALRAKNFILGQLFDVCIAPETIAGITRNPDSNNNDKGMYVKNGHRLYETGLVLMALSTLKDESLKDTVQDLVDYLAYAQVEPDAGGGRGGWRYDTNYRESDMSVTQFPLLGLEAAEYNMGSMGVTIPSYVKDELKNNFLYFVQNKELVQNNEEWGGNSGGFGYSWPNHWVNVAKTGAGLVGLALTGFSYDAPQVTSALQFIDRHWYQAVEAPQGGTEAYNIGDLYAMYAVMKGMKSYEMSGINTTQIGTHDWYNEYAVWEIEKQQENGSWQSPVNSYGPYVDTAFGVLILLPQVFDVGPTALAQASPTQVQPYQPVTFSHSGSFHMDNSKSIVSYAWDFNGDGSVDWTTKRSNNTRTYTYTAPGTYTAILRVTDSAGLTDTDQVTIVVAESTLAPVTIKIEPETLNLAAKGVLTAFITLPVNSNYTLANINTSSLVCEGAPVVNTNMAANKLIAKFNVEDLKGVPAGDKVTLTVTGKFKDGRPFKGFDTIRVISKKK